MLPRGHTRVARHQTTTDPSFERRGVLAPLADALAFCRVLYSVAEGGNLVAESVGLRPVFCVACGLTCVDKFLCLVGHAHRACNHVLKRKAEHVVKRKHRCRLYVRR